MKIEHSTITDVPIIFEIYEIATKFMKSKNQVAWPQFQKKLILNEIDEKRQWKLLIDDQIACIWATAFNDELIWGVRDRESSLYIHRIATHPLFRGQKLVSKLMDWANDFGKLNKLKYIRMDTVGYNKGLIAHYKKFGFDFLGIEKLKNTEGLPAHYSEGGVCLFQKEVAYND